MKTLIIGTGNIGIMHGWAFSEAGIDVTHKVRRGKKDVYRDGITLDILDMRKGYPKTRQVLYAPKITDEVSPSDGYDLVIVPTKHYQAAEAVKETAGSVPEARFLMFCANWEGPGEIDALLPRSRYVWGYAAVNGGILDNVLYANVRDDYRIGVTEGCDRTFLDAVMDLFSKAGFRADFKENMIEWLWVHHGTNGALIGSAIYAGGLAEFAENLENGSMAGLFVNSSKEALKVLEARGVDVRRYPDTNIFLNLSQDQAAKIYIDMFQSPAGRRTIAAGHHRGNIAEMKRYYTDVLEKGIELGIEMPCMLSMRERIERIT
ncbi:MAG TPA: 2-dehydropantoate 2-reductase N-terminal domain-containing protein [Syntrophorhabdaceae bacterium]|nr:2-dehydropantoate 2-reductase N-terminal domain-containing protein [Syntrophorhabdaceae bacterium]